MFERMDARNGQQIFKFKNRLLCSRVNPQGEAFEFIESQFARLEDVPNIFVVGLGCGYHVKALLERLPAKRLIVISANAYLLNQFKVLFPIESAMIEIIEVQDLRSFTESALVKEYVTKFYTTLVFQPATHTEPEIYSSIESMLLGRSEVAFRWLAQLRGQMNAPLTPEPIRILKGGALSIKDILFFESQMECVRMTKSQILTLNELIK